MNKIKLPSVYSILFILTAIIAGLTWIIPAGQYDVRFSETIGKEVPIVNTYKEIESSPQGIIDVLTSPIKGFYDPQTNQARAIDVALFVLIIGGFFGVVNQSKSIECGILQITYKLQGKEIWLIPILMALFALGGTLYGMAEETLPFYAIVIPIMIAAGYDSLTGVAVVMVGAGIGTLASTLNPFATIIASNAAQISFADGLELRVILLLLGWVMCALYVMRYAKKVKNNPEHSLVASQQEADKVYFLKQVEEPTQQQLSLQQKLILILILFTFAIMVVGVSIFGWWMAEMSALFLGATLFVGVASKMGESLIAKSFIEGAKEMLGVAFIIALARGLVVIMDDGNITHSLLHYCEVILSDLPPVLLINAIYIVEALLSFLIPSSSALAVLTMPILAPLADFSEVPRELVVTAYQAASGLPNLVTPTSAIVMGGLALGRIPYGTWLKFVMPLILTLMAMVMVLLSINLLFFI